MPPSDTCYSSPLSAEWLRKVPNLRSKPPLDLNAKVQRGKRKRRQREKTGPRCVFLAGKPVQRPGLLEIAGTSPLSTKSTRETTKTPGFTSPAFSLERNLVQVTLVEESLPSQKVTAVFSQVQRTAQLAAAIHRQHGGVRSQSSCIIPPLLAAGDAVRKF